MSVQGRLWQFSAAWIGIAMVVALAPPTARSDDAPGGRCPSGYALQGSVCINLSSSHVVSASTPQISPAASASGCAPGYVRVADLCLGADMGDVELVDEHRWPERR
jgi:hypothetical protein